MRARSARLKPRMRGMLSRCWFGGGMDLDWVAVGRGQARPAPCYRLGDRELSSRTFMPPCTRHSLKGLARLLADAVEKKGNLRRPRESRGGRLLESACPKTTAAAFRDVGMSVYRAARCPSR